MPTMFANRRTIVVPAALVATANALALRLDPVGGAQTFTVPLSPDGTLPATHYWCSTACDDSAAQQIDAMGAGLDGVRVFGADVAPDDALIACGLKRIETTIGGSRA